MAAPDVLDPSARRLLVGVLACISRAADPKDEEREALAGAMVAMGLDPGLTPTTPLEELELGRLGSRERMLFYSAAVWMALADGIRVRAESDRLAQLQRLLQIGPASARFLERHARWVRTSTGDEPFHRELDLLLTEGARRINAVEVRRAA